MFGRNKEEVPKSVLDMKLEKEKREKEEKRKSRKKEKKTVHNCIDDVTKRKIKKIILILIIIGLIFSGIALGISSQNWKSLVTDMFNNKNSIVIDTNGKTIAELRIRTKKIRC